MFESGDILNGNEMLNTLEELYSALPLITNIFKNENDMLDNHNTLDERPLVLIIDEKCIDYALLRCYNEFIKVAQNCKAVIACRTRKDQKGKLVNLMTKSV